MVACLTSCPRELLLVKGIATQGFGNWKKIAEVVGTRSKEEVEEHYNSVYIQSKDWPLPVSSSNILSPQNLTI
jgi:hypothetical protein